MKFFLSRNNLLHRNDRPLARKMKTRALKKRRRRQALVGRRKNLQNTRHTATCIDWVAELAPCCTKTKWRHIIPHLPPVTSVKNTRTRREIARVRHESSFISCYKRRRRAVSVPRAPAGSRTRVCVSPREHRNDAGLVDAGLLSHQNRFTWPASDKSSPGTVGYPLFTCLYDSLSRARVPSRPHIHKPSVRLSDIEAGLREVMSLGGLLSKFQDIRDYASEFYEFLCNRHIYFVIVFIIYAIVIINQSIMTIAVWKNM